MLSDAKKQKLQKLRREVRELKRKVAQMERRKGSLEALYPRRRGQTVQVIEAVANARTLDKIQTRIDAKKAIIRLKENEIRELERT